jgi:hypothetical protein
VPCRHTRAYAVAQAQPSFCYTGRVRAVAPSSLSYWVNPRHGGGGEERRRATMEGKDGEAWWRNREAVTVVEPWKRARSGGAVVRCRVAGSG